MNIKNNILKFQESLQGTSCKLIAVSKTKPISAILEAYESGITRFGENKVQELTEKSTQLPEDIQWHMIGHLQRNKVKFIAPFISMIHSVDSFRLLKEIDKEGEKNNRIIDCLLQMHIAEEETKFGLSEMELAEMVESDVFHKLKNVNVMGLMGMATFTEDENQIRKEFRTLRKIFEKIKKLPPKENLHFSELSMGMSGDYRIAIEEGSTMIRVGSAIFGSRENLE